MSELLALLPRDPLPFIALFWAASTAFAIICARKYFASRRHASDVAAPMREPFIDAPSAPQDATVQHDAGEPTRDQQPRTFAAPDGPADDATEATLIADIRARIAQDTLGSGLRELVRALYLDESSFTFHTIAELPADDRELAKRLIEAWLETLRPSTAGRRCTRRCATRLSPRSTPDVAGRYMLRRY